MMLEVSNNSLTTYRTCPKKWFWYYIHGLRPRKRVSALALGDTIHKAFDKYYKGEAIADISAWIDKTYKDEIANLPPEEVEQAYIDSKTALGMFLNFPFSSMKFDKIDSEKEFNTPFTKGVKYVGRIDGLVFYNQRWFIREVKTTGETKQMFENRASISSQATGYVWAIQQVEKLDIAGVLYDCLRKPRLFKKQTEDMYEFGQRIYLDYCDKKKQDSYFYRYPTYRNPDQIEMWKDDTERTTRQLVHSLKRSDFPRNTGSCWVFNAECPYRRICFEKSVDPMVIELLYEKKGGTNGGKEEEVPNGAVSG